MRTVSLSVPSNTKTYSDFSKLIERTQEVGGTRGSAKISKNETRLEQWSEYNGFERN